jgi:hypothetical protein
MSRPAGCGRSGWWRLLTRSSPPQIRELAPLPAPAASCEAGGRVRGPLRFQITGRGSSPQSSRLLSERPSSVWRGRAALYQRALGIDETALGPDHSGTATDLNNLAAPYHNGGGAAAPACPRHPREGAGARASRHRPQSSQPTAAPFTPGPLRGGRAALPTGSRYSRKRPWSIPPPNHHQPLRGPAVQDQPRERGGPNRKPVPAKAQAGGR